MRAHILTALNVVTWLAMAPTAACLLCGAVLVASFWSAQVLIFWIACRYLIDWLMPVQPRLELFDDWNNPA